MTKADRARFEENMNASAKITAKILDPNTPESEIEDLHAERLRRIKCAQPWRTDI